MIFWLLEMYAKQFEIGDSICRAVNHPFPFSGQHRQASDRLASDVPCFGINIRYLQCAAAAAADDDDDDGDDDDDDDDDDAFFDASVRFIQCGGEQGVTI